MKSAKHTEQARAQWAYRAVLKLKGHNEKETKSHLRKLPSHIQTSGLAQTLLFYGNKKAEIAECLCEHLQLGRDVAQAVRDLVQEPARFRLKTREAMAAAQWLKRFAEVLLDNGESADKEGGSQ